VLLATYRRTAMLPRALASVLAQTMTDWVCEIHNDDPADPFPAELVRRTGDPRVSLNQHARNLGGTGTFNLIFRATAEPYYALLEDDNWWDPAFLATMVAALEAHPGTEVAWSNQRVWQENEDGSWIDTGRLVQPPEGNGPRLVAWGDPRQAMGGIHANGSALVRSIPGKNYPTPSSGPFTSIEAFRERLFGYPLVYVPAPVAYFAVTRGTGRSGENSRWVISLIMLAATFVRNSGQPPREICRALWQHYAAQRPAPTNILIWAGLIDPACRPFLRLAGLKDWLRWLAGVVRQPAPSWRIYTARRRWPDWWAFLDAAAAERFRTAK
jgi:hypothetical protein